MKRVLFILSLLLNVCLIAYLVHTKGNSFLYGLGLTDNRHHNDEYCMASWGTSIDKIVDSCDVAFIGNSITRGSDFRPYFPTKSIVELGYAGDNLIGIARRARHLKYVNPKKVFVMGGVNDSRSSLKTFERRFNIMIDSLVYYIPKENLYIQNILPVTEGMSKASSNKKLDSLNNLIKDICSQRGLNYIDLNSLYKKDGEMPFELTKDGLHLKSDSYSIWADAIESYILQ